MPKIKLSTDINSTLEICFDLARSIGLHKISTAQTNEEAMAGKASGSIGLNETVTWKAKHSGLVFQLTSLITAFDKPHFFVDKQIKGLFKTMIHEHIFEQAGNKVVMLDTFEFHSPFGIFGKLFNTFFLTNYFKKLLYERNQIIKEYAESAKWKVVLNGE